MKEFVTWNLIDETITDIAFHLKETKKNFKGVLGVSIGKSKNTKTKNAWQDYLHLMDYFYLEADYLAINISSPNTENLRELSKDINLEFLVEKISQKI